MDLMEQYGNVFQGYTFSSAEKTGQMTTLILENDSGTGTMRCYDVLPGVTLTYNSLQMSTCYQQVSPVSGFININHCRRGCFEFELQDGNICFLGEGDMAVNDPEIMIIINSRLPLGIYEGISVMIELASAEAWLKEQAPWAYIDLFALRQSLNIRGISRLLRARPEISHLFDELYHIDNQSRSIYLRLKVIEMLLFLSDSGQGKTEPLQRFTPAVTEATKEVYQYLHRNPMCRNTLSELSAKFHVAETSFKCCFKTLYGQTPGCFVRNNRMKIAAGLLMDNPLMNISDIALLVGYENPSKFAAAFRGVMKETPLAYRHRRA